MPIICGSPVSVMERGTEDCDAESGTVPIGPDWPPGRKECVGMRTDLAHPRG